MALNPLLMQLVKKTADRDALIVAETDLRLAALDSKVAKAEVRAAKADIKVVKFTRHVRRLRWQQTHLLPRRHYHQPDHQARPVRAVAGLLLRSQLVPDLFFPYAPTEPPQTEPDYLSA